jgi:hypothetical protein
VRGDRFACCLPTHQTGSLCLEAQVLGCRRCLPRSHLRQSSECARRPNFGHPGLAALRTTAVMFAGYALATRMRLDLRRLCDALGDCGAELGPLLLIGGAAGCSSA